MNIFEQVEQIEKDARRARARKRRANAKSEKIPVPFLRWLITSVAPGRVRCQRSDAGVKRGPRTKQA